MEKGKARIYWILDYKGVYTKTTHGFNSDARRTRNYNTPIASIQLALTY
jgi:hypothetical protein